jgi:hypothetical protein
MDIDDASMRSNGSKHQPSDSLESKKKVENTNCTCKPISSANINDPTDGRKPYEWKTKYEKEALNRIWVETTYLLILLVTSFIFILATWKGCVGSWFSILPKETTTFKQYAYYIESGMLGGVTFDMKYLYRTVARGLWHKDRAIWRVLSPFVATTIAFIIGSMIDASMITAGSSISGASCVSVGFLSGYFADSAVGKMSEVAMVLFGKSSIIKDCDEK